jgi:hypothetical protein
MVFLSFFPPSLLCGIAGPEETKNQREMFLRLIQIRLAPSGLEKSQFSNDTLKNY